MDNKGIAVGLKGRMEQTVTPQMSAAHVGSGLVEVFATPMMIAMMENTCSDSVLPYLDEGQGTVGTRVNTTHEAATAIGMRVWCESELIEVEGRKLVFSVKAYDEGGLIGQGVHERFIIDKDRFMAKAQARAEKAKE